MGLKVKLYEKVLGGVGFKKGVWKGSMGFENKEWKSSRGSRVLSRFFEWVLRAFIKGYIRVPMGLKNRVEKVSRVLGRGWIMISDSNNSQGNIYIKKVSAQNNMKPISKLEGKNITNKK